MGVNWPEVTYPAMVLAGTALTMPKEVNTQYRPAPIVTRMVAFGTSRRGVRVSSAMGATMSKAAIASTANSSAVRKPVQPAVAAVGLSGWNDRFPAMACLMMMKVASAATKPASIAMNHPITLADTRMSFFVMYPTIRIGMKPARVALRYPALTPK